MKSATLKHVQNVNLRLMVISLVNNFLRSNMEIGFRIVLKHMFALIVDVKLKKMVDVFI